MHCCDCKIFIKELKMILSLFSLLRPSLSSVIESIIGAKPFISQFIESKKGYPFYVCLGNIEIFVDFLVKNPRIIPNILTRITISPKSITISFFQNKVNLFVFIV